MNFKEKCDLAYEKGQPIIDDDEYDARFNDANTRNTLQKYTPDGNAIQNCLFGWVR